MTGVSDWTEPPAPAQPANPRPAVAPVAETRLFYAVLRWDGLGGARQELRLGPRPRLLDALDDAEHLAAHAATLTPPGALLALETHVFTLVGSTSMPLAPFLSTGGKGGA